ncbi:MAG: glycine cleavage system aminomethyltransferase GcvT [Phycisphaerales bacterium]|jgi:aminomethyltransferase|nr:glycine cleavage system aminomethyltransferase GcvT [Planctomycetota bacterium]
MANDTPSLLKTPFHAYHVEQGGRMVDFAGWEMPLLFTSILEEHRQVRTSGGFFDVSHMGRLRFSGRHARRFLDRVCTRRVLGMENGQCRYSLVCNEQGGCRDDVLIYAIDDDEFLMVCNASNRAKLLEHFEAQRGDMVFKMKDETESTAMVAIQGPRVMEVIGRFSREIPTLKRYRFARKNLLVIKLLVSRTGYTGEDGVEVILPAGGLARQALKLMLDADGGESDLLKPAGLGARDTLRMEAGMPLYGHEIEEDVDPLTAGLGFAVSLDKGEGDDRAGRFIGQDALQRIHAEGPARRLVGIRLTGRRSPRQGMKVLHNGEEVGRVTSGCVSPTLEVPIAMALVASAAAEVGTGLEVDLGRETSAGEVVPMPFYKAPKPAAAPATNTSS